MSAVRSEVRSIGRRAVLAGAVPAFPRAFRFFGVFVVVFRLPAKFLLGIEGTGADPDTLPYPDVGVKGPTVSSLLLAGFYF